MKKCIFLFVILNICAISTLHSQWLEKEGYWELSEKIPELRDLKILSEENLIITVSKDNTIRHIEYDSGKILKSGKPAGLPDSNDYAKISSDGKTTVVARYVKNELHSTKERMTINDLELIIVRNYDNKLLVHQLFDADSVIEVDIYSKNNQMYNLEYYNYSIGYFDYFSSENRFFYTINYTLSWKGQPNTGGEPTYDVSSGYQRNGSIVEGKLITTKHYNSHYTNEYIPLDKYHENYILVGLNDYSMWNAHISDVKKSTFIATKSRLLNDFNIKANYSYSYYSSRDAFDDYGSTESGEKVPIYQLFGSRNPKICYYRISGKLIELDIEAKKNLNTYEHQLFKKVINMSNDSKFIHTIESNDYVIYSFPYYKEIFRVGIDTVFALPKTFLDERNGVILIPNSDHRLVMLKPDAMTDVPKYGFDWSKDSVYTNEEMKFRALTNIAGCIYEWQFSNGDIIKSDTNDITYKFIDKGKFGVTLTITKPDGTIISFTKDSIITVFESVKADFEVTKLNSELPLKVQFTDISKGANTSWTWDFGDGESSSDQNPVHIYNYSGDFSPSLIVSDGIVNDTIRKYEHILINVNNPITQVPDFARQIFRNKISLQNVFLTNDGFSLNWYGQISAYDPDFHIDKLFLLLKSFHFDFNLNKTDEVVIMPTINFDILYNIRPINLINKVDLIVNFYNINEKKDYGLMTYNLNSKELKTNHNTDIFNQIKNIQFKDSNSIWISALGSTYTLFKCNNNLMTIWKLMFPEKNIINMNIDTTAMGVHVLAKNDKNIFQYFLVSKTGSIEITREFVMDTDYTVTSLKSINDDLVICFGYHLDTTSKLTFTNIKQYNSIQNKVTVDLTFNSNVYIRNYQSVHENLILLHGYYNDKLHKTTYAYFAKYHPLDNTLQDTILYSRKDIRKLERVSNSLYAAIGQSRGRQGYLLLDTNLHQIKDIRVDSLTGEIKDMLLHDKKVYLFTEKIVSLPTMALGDKESYQTTASVLGLPEDIIASVEKSPIIFTDKLTHSAYPNPTNEVLNLKVATNETANYTIKLYDIFGTEIINIHDGFIPAKTEKIFNIPTSALSIGSYYYVISGGGNVERGKVMVVR